MATAEANANSQIDEATNQCTEAETCSSDTEDNERAASRRLAGNFTEDEKTLLKKWRDANDWAELVDLNCQFLRGELPFAPYHMGSICQETNDLLPALLRLHQLGILTMESQPAKVDTHECTNPAHSGSCWTRVEQRPYINFLLPYRNENNTLYILRELASSDEIWTSVTDGHLVSNLFPEDWFTHRYTRAASKADLDDPEQAEVHTKGTFEPDCGCWLRAFDYEGVESPAVEKARPLMVDALAKDVEDKDLAGKIAEIVEQKDLIEKCAEIVAEARDRVL